MNTRYHKIPTFRRQIFITSVSLLVYSGFLYAAKYSVKDISEDMRRFWGQAGLIFVFISALLAGLGFFWNLKAKENIATAQSEIEHTVATISLLTQLQKDIGSDFSGHSARFEERMKVSKQQLDQATNFPKVLDWVGVSSLVLLGIGTIFQFVSLG